jgi:UDP-N-acetylglucosamine 2-epimerase
VILAVRHDSRLAHGWELDDIVIDHTGGRTDLSLSVKLLFVGGGPAGLAPLIWAARNGALAQIASQGIAIVERGSDLGAGALRDHAIGSDTLAETFLECLADGPEPRLCALRSHEAAVRIRAFSGGSAPLPLVATFLDVLGRTMQEILQDVGATILTSHEAEQSHQLPDGRWRTRIIGPEGLTRDIVSERLVLATGAEQQIEDIDAERIDGRALFPALRSKIMLSGEALAHGGGLRIAMRLAGRPDPKVAIIGGSHSALASANLLLANDTGIAFSEGGLSLLHRRPLRIFYPSVTDALAEGYTDFTADDLCPKTQRLYRLAGFRLEARELAKRVMGVGGAAAEPRVKLCTLSGTGTQSDPWRVLHEADLVIAAMGYRPRALRLLDSDGRPILLAAHAARAAPLVDGECRVIDQSQIPIPGVFALGLAAGFVPRGKILGGEPSFRGQTNGLWLWQNDIGAIIIRNCRGERAPAQRRRTPRSNVAVVVGTRPEAIKLAPVVLEMRNSTGITASIWCTGQHAQWAPLTLSYFGLKPDRIIESTETGNGLSRLGGTLLLGLQAAIAETRPDVIVVQGDTSSAFMGAMAAAYAGVPVVHVEAGLRSGSRRTPFPEEPHRCAIAHFTALHCAPTEIALNHLRQEGIAPEDIVVSGNTVIDALHYVRQTVSAKPEVLSRTRPDRPLVLMTCHRRENWGAVFVGICLAVRQIGERGDCDLVFVLHPNPVLADIAINMLSGIASIHLVAPLGYPDFVQLLTHASLILTDSGGIQEEATALGAPLLILRENTERPEALSTGNARIIGIRQENIVAAVNALLADPAALAASRKPSTVYGDGHAARRIVEAISHRWKGSERRAANAYINTAAAPRASKETVPT